MGLFQWLPFGSVPEIISGDLARAMRLEEVQVLDVRTAPEFHKSRIPGAQHLPITRFSAEAVLELELDRDRPVIAICLSAHRSIPAVRQLRKMGYDAKQLKGGMKAWWEAGLPCEEGAP